MKYVKNKILFICLIILTCLTVLPFNSYAIKLNNKYFVKNKTFSIIFYANNGTFDSTKKNYVSAKTKYNTSTLADVSNLKIHKNGYIFDGWWTKNKIQIYDKEGHCINNEKFWKNNKYKYYNNLIVYAKWIKDENKNYTIKYDGNNATNGNMTNSSHIYDKESKLNKNQYTKTGYTFKEWNTKSDGSGNSYQDQQLIKNLTSTNGETVTLYAQWKTNTYNIKYDGNNATNGNMTNSSHIYDKESKLNKNQYTKTGYTFKEWNTKSDGSGNSYQDQQLIKNLTSTNGETVTLYAQWKTNTYNIKYDGNNATNGNMTNSSHIYDKESKLNKNQYTKTGYTFKEWNTKSDGSGNSYQDQQLIKNLTSTNGETVTLYAQWIKNSSSINSNNKNIATRLDMNYNIPDKYNTGTNGELTDFLELYPNAKISNNIIYIDNNFVKTYGNSIGNFKLTDKTLYFKDNIGDFNISNANFIGNEKTYYAVQTTQNFLSNNCTLTLTNCEGSYFKAAFCNGMNTHLYNCQIHDMYQDGIKCIYNVIVENCYVNTCGMDPSSHADGIQISSNNTENLGTIFVKNSRFEQPNVKDKYTENACVFLKLDKSSSGHVNFENLILNGGNYTMYLLHMSTNYSNLTYNMSNILFGNASKYGNISTNINNLTTNEFSQLNKLYICSVFKKNDKVYVSVSNDTNQERILKIVTENETKEVSIEKTWDGNTISNSFQNNGIDVLIELKDCNSVKCYDENRLIGEFSFN